MDVEPQDPFLDDYGQEIFVCCDIVDKCRMIADNKVTVTFNKEFLIKMLYSYIRSIREISHAE